MIDRIWQWLLGAEPAELAGEGEWRLGLLADYNNYVKLGLILAFVALVWLTIRSYRREGHAPRAAKAGLAVLRIAALTLVLVVLLRPAIILRFTRTLYSSVVVVLDDSRSMSFTDRYAEDPNTRQALAEKLGIPEPQLAQLSRQELARRVLGGADGPLAKLAKDHPLLMLRFSTDKPGSESYTRLLGEIDATGGDPNAPARLDEMLSRLEARGFETSTPSALRAALERSRG
ncbi:MAG: hypothetical protein ACOC93_02095, partial [Planctomycetota bacterium]